MVEDIQISQRPAHKIPLRESEVNAFVIRRSERPSIWAQTHFRLTTAYARNGELTLFPWQVEPVDAIAEYDMVILCGAVQTGKSLIAECHLAWIIDCHPMNAMICYAKTDTVKNIFDERLRPMVEEVPCIKKYWDGNPDRLTQKKITLNHMIVRIASAEVKSDIATYSAGYVYASEVAKYPKKDFDQVRALLGRQEGYRILGSTKSTFESSPEQEGDPLHALMFRKGVRNCQPYMPCPNCGHYQVLIDEQIKELPNDVGEFDHNAERIRNDNAARYECVECHNEIKEEHRIDMGKKVVWADEREKISATGQVLNKVKARSVSFQWNRLVDYSHTFAECLARFFEARQSISSVSLKTYQNEDMARFAKTESKQFSTNWLLTKREKYMQYGETAGYPAGVLLLTCGMDTQDAGFYYVVRGWGANMETWLVRHDWIECSTKDETYQNSDNLVSLILQELSTKLPSRLDGVQLPVTFGFIDRGGHRQKEVDYLCSRVTFLHPYIGTVNRRAPLIDRSRERHFYLGHTENLSKMVEAHSESNLWHLPEDTGETYCMQFVKQYWQDKIDRVGNTKSEYVHGGNDHYRDTENLNMAAAVYLQLEKRMFSDVEMSKIRDTVGSPEHKPKQTDETIEGADHVFHHPRNKQQNAIGNYMSRYRGF